MARTGGGFLARELVPSSRDNFRGALVEINSMGMRDREYSKEKPPGTVRIAVLGASITMGWGVGNEETFENRLEERLNRDSGGARAQSYEVLNFAVPAYTELEQVWVLDKRALQFSPDVMLIVLSSQSVDPIHRFAEKIKWELPLIYPTLTKIRDGLQLSGDEAVNEEAIAKRLEPDRDRLDSWIFRRLAQRSKTRGLVPVAVLMPGPRQMIWPRRMILRAERLREYGFGVFDLLGVYGDQNREDMAIMKYDNHPSVLAHQLIADRLFEALRGNRQTAAIIWGDGVIDGGS